MSHVLTPRRIAQQAYDAGFRGSALATAVAVALAESGGDPHAHNAVPPDDSYGLWQVNMIGSLGPDRRRAFHLKSDAALFDPAVNARAAWSISGQGTSFQPWSTYTNGAYRAHLPAARAAVRAVSGDVKKPTAHPAPTHGRVVLDLAELSRLARLFEDSAARVEHTRLALRRLAADVEPARARLADPALATLVTNVLTALDAPTQLPLVAERLQRQGTYAAKVRRLAERADGGDGKWSAADARRFVASIGPTTDPYERAVKEALLGGVIVRGGHLAGRIGGHVSPSRDTGTRLPDPGVGGLKNGRVPPSRLGPVGDGETMTRVAAGRFRRMDAAARAAGLDLRVNSGYRTYAEQARLYDAYVHGRGNLAAAPGESTHGLGLSADIDVRDPRTLAWLRAHAATYGFVNDVPSESWHWTYRPH
ncbi:D-alanyl-D-alanine carboxypeptidase family protein [Actinoallomurus sp. CA-142502]|uniref:D-alanyl-D-alanine carboxypeptidase family protein n=1 Tax=Actinoallomurus sp. CA-142502 TaxID=3239885 RepID=UPI003D8DE176